MKKTLSIILALLFLIGLSFFLYWLVSGIYEQFKLLDTKVAVAILTASTTIIVSTLAVVLGKYYERQKEIEAHYREKKILIYDEFLNEFFKLMHSEDNEKNAEDLTSFLREWQRKMILWGGQDVLSQYIEWMQHLKKGVPDAETMYMTEDFFRAVRKDLGHKSDKLKKGSFIYLLLQNTELFFAMAKENPKVTLAEIAEMEEKLKS